MTEKPGSGGVPPEAIRVPPVVSSVPPATVTVAPGTVSVPPGTVSVPPGTVSVPPATVSVPPGTVSVPPSTVSVPPGTVSVPPSTVSVPPATISVAPGKSHSSLAATISVRDVTRDYRGSRVSLFRQASAVHALRGISFDVQQGERFGIVGESGCGKSTLLRILAGLDQPTSGSVVIDGTDISRLPERKLTFLRERLQMVFQDPMSSLDPRMRVRDIIAEPLVAQGIGDRQGRVVELLEAVGLGLDAAGRFPHQLSGGQRQRVSIARALAPRPGILVADEPVSALDVSVRAQVLNLMTDLVRDLSLTLVFVSHDLSVVRHVCDRVAVMHQGQIVETGPTREVYEDPQHPYTRKLVSAVPSLRNALAGASAADLAGHPPDDSPEVS